MFFVQIVENTADGLVCNANELLGAVMGAV